MTSFASLSSSLLARKGQAKPAMRPQTQAAANGQDDLGWNDMGHIPGGHVPGGYVQPAPMPVQSYLTPLPGGAGPVAHADPIEPPAVHRQQAEIAQEFGPAEDQPIAAEVVAAEPVPAIAELPVARVAAGSKAKAAFTLRLDAERHLRLRLACAVRHQSAQRLVVEALDALLATVPALDDLAARVPPAKR